MTDQTTRQQIDIDRARTLLTAKRSELATTEDLAGELQGLLDQFDRRRWDLESSIKAITAAIDGHPDATLADLTDPYGVFSRIAKVLPRERTAVLADNGYEFTDAGDLARWLRTGVLADPEVQR